jgi:hypothetical protein
MLLSSSCWVVVPQSLDSHPTVFSQPSGRQLSGSCQAVVRQLSGSCQAVVRQLSGSCQAVIKQSSGRQAVDEKMNQWFQGTPEESSFGKQGTGKGTNWDIASGDRRGHSPITIIFRG